MISVFVWSEKDDFRWNATPSLSQEPNHKGRFNCHARGAPTPTMVLSPRDESVSAFVSCISKSSASVGDRASVMEKFIRAMRGKIEQCDEVEMFREDPLCVFIHFGGGDHYQYNERLHDAWAALQSEEVKQKFLCFAISRHDTSDKVINKDWLSDDGVIELPDNDKQLMAVLEKGCKLEAWGRILVPEPFTKSSLNGQNEQPTKPKETICNINSSSANGRNDDSTRSKPGEVQDNQMKFQLNARLACVLKWIVVTEMVAGFVLSWGKSFFTHSFAVEFCFGVLGLVFFIIPVVLLWNAHEDKPQANCDSNSKLKKALELPEDVDEAKVLKAVKELKSRMDKQQDKDKNAEAEQFAMENAIKADKTALKKAYQLSPDAAKVLVAGISDPKATSTQDNS